MRTSLQPDDSSTDGQGNWASVVQILDHLIEDYAYSPQANCRKGGLLALAAAAVALAERKQVWTLCQEPQDTCIHSHHDSHISAFVCYRAIHMIHRCMCIVMKAVHGGQDTKKRVEEWAGPDYLAVVVPPVLNSLVDADARVRYYACEALYNIAKVSRDDFLEPHFNCTFDALFRLVADPDPAVNQATTFLDALMKVHLFGTQNMFLTLKL